MRSDEGSQDEMGEGEDADRMEFVPKEYFARPYSSDTMDQTIQEVQDMTITGKRPLIKMRLTKKRREFNNQN